MCVFACVRVRQKSPVNPENERHKTIKRPTKARMSHRYATAVPVHIAKKLMPEEWTNGGCGAEVQVCLCQ